MIKAIIMFVVFFVIDVILLIVLANLNAYAYFMPAIFIEISIYGSFILYNIADLKEQIKQKNKIIGDKKSD